MADRRNSPDAMESFALPVRQPLLVGLGCLVLLLTAMGVLWFPFSASVPDHRRPPPQSAPAPRLRPAFDREVSKVAAEQRDRLAGWRWVDRKQNIVAIPIARAMALIAERGSDAYGPVVQTAPQPSPAEATSTDQNNDSTPDPRADRPQ